MKLSTPLSTQCNVGLGVNFFSSLRQGLSQDIKRQEMCHGYYVTLYLFYCKHFTIYFLWYNNNNDKILNIVYKTKPWMCLWIPGLSATCAKFFRFLNLLIWICLLVFFFCPTSAASQQPEVEIEPEQADEVKQEKMKKKKKKKVKPPEEGSFQQPFKHYALSKVNEAQNNEGTAIASSDPSLQVRFLSSWNIQQPFVTLTVHFQLDISAFCFVFSSQTRQISRHVLIKLKFNCFNFLF